MPSATALLSIDLQNDYLARPGLVPDRETLVAHCAALLDHARAQGWTVVHVRTEAQPGRAMPHRLEMPEVVAGSAGAEPPPPLAPIAGEAVVIKRFFDPFDDPALEALLHAQAVERVVLMGVHSHACIREAATSAYARGFAVAIAEEAVASDAPSHGELALEWLERRSMARAGITSFGAAAPPPEVWSHRDPTDTRNILWETGFTPRTRVDAMATELVADQRDLGAMPPPERAGLLRIWQRLLVAARSTWVDALIADVAKPRRDAEGEVDYGLALLDEAIAEAEREPEAGVARHPHGLVALVTPWNNPFAIPIGKLAPALGFGNAALWKPALPGARVADLLLESLNQAGLGRWVGLAQGGAAIGHAVVANREVAAISFTGSVEVGRSIIAAAGLRAIPVQAELGGSNAAIVDESCDLDLAAADLAQAIFSFSGQRCTAIRRLVVLDPVYDRFAESLAEAVSALRIGKPIDADTAIGPLIGKSQQQAILGIVDAARRSGGRIRSGGAVPPITEPAGCWIEPTLVEAIDPRDEWSNREMFGPLCALYRASDFDQAVAIHNFGDFGLLGALFSADPSRQAQFLRSAQAGILSIGRARPAFSAAGPFVGWKASGFGPPEHGRWNREAYTRTQAIYGS